MARFPQSQTKKGSQKWIQKLVNDRPQILNTRIWGALNPSAEEDIQWLSPLKNDGYAEYRDEAFLDRLGIKLEKEPLKQFWPSGGPQWDALGKSSSGKVFLVEAKSHVGELISTLQAKNSTSAERIRESLDETKTHLGSKVEFDWTKTFYQYTNRLAHLYLLRKNDIDAYLVLVYFVGDWEMKGPATASEWKGAVELVSVCLGTRRHPLKKYIMDLFIKTERIR